MVVLREMTQGEFDEYYLHGSRALAEAFAASEDLAWSEAERRACASFARALPGLKVSTPGQCLRVIESEGLRVGVVWYAFRRDRQPADLFVFDLIVDVGYRGRGIGRAAMMKVEDVARKEALTRISLHVFDENSAARRFYTRLGYDGPGPHLTKEVEALDGPEV